MRRPLSPGPSRVMGMRLMRAEKKEINYSSLLFSLTQYIYIPPFFFSCLTRWLWDSPISRKKGNTNTFLSNSAPSFFSTAQPKITNGLLLFLSPLLPPVSI